MIATSLLYLQSKFELAGMNIYYSVTKMEKNNFEQYYAIKLCVKQGKGTIHFPMKRFRMHLVMIPYHVLKHFGGTKSLKMGKKQWKMNHNLDALPL
jgi:hypothetical protein